MPENPVMTLFCRACDSPNQFGRRWIEDDDACTTCGARGQWRTINDPKHAWALNHNDRSFLKGIRVSADA